MSPVFSTSAGEQEVAAANGHTAQGAFGPRVVDLDGAIVALVQQCRPKFECIPTTG
jgi:hypothetical protein